MLKIIAAGAAAAAALVSAAKAEVVAAYDVFSTSNVNCSSAPHGLWTNTKYASDGACGQYFDIKDGMLTIFEEDGERTAELMATAENPFGRVAEIMITFGGYTTDFPYFKGGEPGADAEYFAELVEGVITVTLGDETHEWIVEALAGQYAFQIGTGANDKNGEYGASTWLKVSKNGDDYAKHWDINVELEPKTTVSEPAGVAILGLGLIGLGAAMRRRRA